MNKDIKHKFCAITYDEDGNTIHNEYELGIDYWFNDRGALKENIEPIKINGEILTTSGWPIYNCDWGHCGLCGNIHCRGTCQGGS